MTYLSILAAIPLLLVVAGPSLINSSDAANGDFSLIPHFGTQSEVCGDHLCNAHKTVTAVSRDNVITDASVLHDHLPEIEIVEAHNFRGSDPNSYIVTIKVTAGKQNLENVQIQVISDVGTTGSIIGGLFATDDTIVVVRTHAMDPGSITAKVLSYQVSN